MLSGQKISCFPKDIVLHCFQKIKERRVYA